MQLMNGIGSRQRAHSMMPMLGALHRVLHPALFTPRALARLSDTMMTIPDALTTLFYLETRLGDDPAVDLVLHVGPESRHLLLGDVSRDDSDSWQQGTPPWERVGALARAWGDARSPLSASLHHLWLEFDVGEAATGTRPTPSVFACFGEVRRLDYTADRWLAHSLAALVPLLDGVPSPALGHRLAVCFANLPDDAYLPYVGVMLGRQAESVRLCITGLTPATLGAYLRAVGWTRRANEVATLVGELSDAQPDGPLRGAGIIHLDVSALGAWRVGLEFACDRAPQLHGELREIALLAALSRLGLASTEKTAALLRWPGTAVVRVPAARDERVLVRRVNHVKVVLMQDEPPQAKAYLAARHLPRAELHPASSRKVCVTEHSHGNVLCT